jgi:transposase
MEITTIGLDLAKSVFQVHAVDAAGNVVVRKALRRSQVLPFFAKCEAEWDLVRGHHHGQRPSKPAARKGRTHDCS